MRIDTNRVILIDDTPETLALSEGTVASESVFLVSPINPDDPASPFTPVGAFDGPEAMNDAELFVFYATGQHLIGGSMPSTEIDTVSDWRSDFGVGEVPSNISGLQSIFSRAFPFSVKPAGEGLDISGAEEIPTSLAEVLFGKDQAAEIESAQKAFSAFVAANKALEAEGYKEIESLALWDAAKTYPAGEVVFHKGAVFGAPATMDAGIAPNPEANEPWVRVQMLTMCNDPTDHDCKAGDMLAKLEALAAEEAALNTPADGPAPTDASLN